MSLTGDEFGGVGWEIECIFQETHAHLHCGGIVCKQGEHFVISLMNSFMYKSSVARDFRYRVNMANYYYFCFR